MIAIGLCGCGAWLDNPPPNASTNPDDYVGAHVFTQMNVPPEKLADFLILKKGGTATEIRVSSTTGEAVTTQTTWRLEREPREVDIIIGNAGYPVMHSPPQVKLGVDLDLDQYYERIHYDVIRQIQTSF